jgi:hypothetical protein
MELPSTQKRNLELILLEPSPSPTSSLLWDLFNSILMQDCPFL